MPRERSAPSVPPGTRGIAARVAVFMALYACLVVMLRTAEGASLSLFLGRMGADRLPWGFLAISLVDVPLAFVFMAVARRVPSRVVLAALAVLLVVLLAASRLVMARHASTGLMCAYTTAIVLNTFVQIQWGIVILEFFTVEESMRAFPLIYVGAHAGSFAAGLVLQHLAVPFGTENLLVFAPLAACGVALVLVVVAGSVREGRAWRQGDGPRPGAASGLVAIRRLGLLRRSTLLRAVAVTTSVMVLMRLALRYSYGAGFEQAFPETDDLTRFIGTYTTYAAIGGIALQVIITPRLLRWLGVGLLNAVYSWIVAGALALSAAVPGLPAAVVARMTDLDLKSALKTPLSPMFYEALGEKDRKDGRAIILGIVSPLASLVSSLMLIVLTTAGISAAWIAGAGALVGVGFIVASHVQGRAYRASLEALLVDWHREHGAGADPTLDEAIEAALASGDRRIGDMAREIRRRR